MCADMTRTERPYGAWTSPITAELVAEADNRPSWPAWHGDRLVYAQALPEEGGRVGLFAHGAGGPVELLATPWNVRNRVHEYGGRPWTSVPGAIVFTNWDDQRLYALEDSAGQPRPITAEPGRPHGARYTDLHPGPDGSVWCVRETVTGDRPTDVTRDVVAVPLDGGEPRTVLATHHFLSVAKVSPDGRHLAWLGWDHPAMPWNGTELCVAEMRADGTAGEHRVLAGGPREAVCQFEWEDSDNLVALTDPTGWWNLYRVPLSGQPGNLAPLDAECGGALWVAGSQWFAQLGGGRFVLLRGGTPVLVGEDGITEIGGLADIPVFSAMLAVRNGTLYATAAGPARKSALVAVDLERGGYTELTGQPADLPDPAYLPTPESRTFTDEAGNEIPAIVFPPANPGFTAPEGELPPFVVHVHGGPTGAVAPVLSLEFAYLTSRGIGVVAVNHGGSTGHGRAFRERLEGQWGVVDLADCATVVAALGREGTADPGRLAIRGGSAGGYSAAHAIATTGTYHAATVRFPVIDMLRFAEGDTHDFESQYLHSLVGALPGHEQRYRDRSPITHVGEVRDPVLVLQGDEDAICPPEQARAFSAALGGTGIPHAYLEFAGEQHGFRKAANIITAMCAELSFYGQVFGFVPPAVEPIELRK